MDGTRNQNLQNKTIEQPQTPVCLGILAHVDAGKTTLSEALLYQTGVIRTLGRVDHRDTYLDTGKLERERDITIFSKQAELSDGTWRAELLDTPGHADFSAEMERTLQVLDYAILVVSGTDGVQGHTRTLWRLLSHYQIPTFLFINKMDLKTAEREKISQELKRELSDGCIDFSPERRGEDAFYEELALTEEALLNEYMESGSVSEETLQSAISRRLVFPCFYGSALKLEGIGEFLEGLKAYAKAPEYPKEFSARVYKIARDPKGARLTYLKVTGGKLGVKDAVSYGQTEEKADQLRKYSGEKYRLADCVQAGEVCAVTGLTETMPGQGLGACRDTTVPVLEPVLSYRVLLPQGVNPAAFYGKLKQLEEEEPQMHPIWNEKLQEIHVQIMGPVQLEVLTRLIEDRFQVKAEFGQGSIVYKETIAKPVEGVGHFEPLRHYAEVHLLLEPADRGSGIQVFSDCSEDMLDLNWQRLIAAHIQEREHPGVLTGAAVTDMKCTIVAGRAHLKHTEGGDFRQATYRAIRQGLKSTECILLEPYYSFFLRLPAEVLGRAMGDLRQRFAVLQEPEFVSEQDREYAVLRGKAPVAVFQEYMGEIHAYAKGQETVVLELAGYDVCHNTEEVVQTCGYDSEADAENPTGSVFCSHGAGLYVAWDEVAQHMHLEYVWKKKPQPPKTALVSRERKKEKETLSDYELDKELQEIYAREFGMNKEAAEEQERRRWAKKRVSEAPPRKVRYDKKGEPIYPKKEVQEEFIIVDGYNIIFAWEELNELAKVNMDSARDRLKDILSNYQGYRGCRLLVVFDAYKTKGNLGKSETYHNIQIVYTRQDETADMYIEKTVHELGKRYRVTVATSDGLEQLTVLSMGALRISARELREEIERTAHEGYEEYLQKKMHSTDKSVTIENRKKEKRDRK